MRLSPSGLLVVLATLQTGCGVPRGQSPAPIAAAEVEFRHLIARDPRASVYLLEIPPHHATVMHRHETDMLTVFVSGGATRNTVAGRGAASDSIASGEVRYRRAGFTHATENIGPSAFRAVIFEFTAPSGGIEPSGAGDTQYCDEAEHRACVTERVALCTTAFCAKQVRIDPGATWRDRDSSYDQVLVAISDCALVERRPDAVRQDQRKSGEVVAWPAGSGAAWKNNGTAVARLVDVVFR